MKPNNLPMKSLKKWPTASVTPNTLKAKRKGLSAYRTKSAASGRGGAAGRVGPMGAIVSEGFMGRLPTGTFWGELGTLQGRAMRYSTAG